MRTTKSTLQGTGYRDNQIAYVHKLCAPRTAEWVVELHFPSRYDLRIASTPAGMAMPTVYAGRTATSLKPLADSGFPRALNTRLNEIVVATARAEHQAAILHGTPPSSNNRVAWYRDRGHSLTPEQAAEADRVTDIIRKGFLNPQQLIEAAVQIAQTTIPASHHQNTIARLESDLAEATRSLLTQDTTEESPAPAAPDLRALHAAVTETMTRMRNRDLAGTYGRDDLERVVDLWEPVSENLRQIVSV